MNEKIIAEVKNLIAAPSCCTEARAAAESWLASLGTENEEAETEKLVAELKEDIETVDELIAFTESSKCDEIFGERAEGFRAHAKELKASGARYCDCPACAACEKILDLLCETRLPAYPLITVDPFFTIWSHSEKLYDDDAMIWYGARKRFIGTVTVDGEAFRFMGKDELPAIPQISRKVTPYITYYSFRNGKTQLDVKFYTPLVLGELEHLTMPCSYIDCTVKSVDGGVHDVKVSLSFDGEFCYNKTPQEIETAVGAFGKLKFAQMGLKNQIPLSKSGDNVSAEWGYFYLCGNDAEIGSDEMHKINASCSGKTDGTLEFNFIAAYDDVYSIEYMGEKLKGLWTEKFKSIGDAIAYCDENRKMLYEKLLAQNEMILADSEKYGEAYQSVLTAAARQVLAGHKLVRNTRGELLYLSKECYSNGCINTVDVSYPALPMFLLYNPELVKAMMTGIFEFSRSVTWDFDFAPHDIGQYPIADGQVYALKKEFDEYRRKIFAEKRDYFKDYEHMPVEECGNMLVMSYTYYHFSGDSSQMSENYDLLEKWANYLVKKGVVLDNQLCTDDFAGHSEKNVNLAVKAIMGIACFDRISRALGKKSDYDEIAKKYAAELVSLCDKNGYLSFSIGNDESWSLKYNMAWDIVLGFNLFDKKLYAAESEKYRMEINKYGVPLDMRKDFTKTDWMLWSSVLDESGENTSLFSKRIMNYLRDTEDRYPFSDWYETKEPKECSFRHRTVQGGLWMPVLKDKCTK